MRKRTKALLIGVSLILGNLILALAFFDHRPIAFQSQESKTVEGAPVFNRIRYISERNRDIWMMQQSHKGIKPDVHTWDRLAIVIDKTKSPKQAHFFQLQPGELEWRENPKMKEFRVSCFLCHSNGPRAIRPQSGSKDVELSLLDRVRIAWWNLRIKSYGRVAYDPSHDASDMIAKVPFRFHSAIDNSPLEVGVCMNCHKDSGLFARGVLTRQNALTIDFMISQGHMPPLWFTLSDSDLKKVRRFLSGL
jgi:hypothetical protein